MTSIIMLLAAAVVASFLKWTTNIYIALIVVVLEGAIRKWVLPGQEFAIYFLKDAFIIIGIIKAYTRHGIAPFKNIPTPLLTIHLAAALFIIADVFNNRVPVMVGFIGAKAYLLYSLLAPLGFYLFPGWSQLRLLFKRTIWLAIPVGLLGIAQFYSSPDSSINTYASVNGDVMDIATFGSTGNARVTGTFPYLSGMGCFVNFSTICCLGLLMTTSDAKDKRLCWVTLPLLIVVGYMTGARSVVLFQLLCVIVFLLIAGVRLRDKIILIGLVCIGGFYSGPGVAARQAFVSRMDDLKADDLGNTTTSLVGPITSVWSFAFDVGAMGYGTGSEHQSRPAVEDKFGVNGGEEAPIAQEWEFTRVMIELGPIGFLLWTGTRVGWTILPLIMWWQMRGSIRQKLAAVYFIFFAAQYTLPVVYNHVFSLYFWIVAGFVIALRNEEAQVEVGVRTRHSLMRRSSYFQ